MRNINLDIKNKIEQNKFGYIIINSIHHVNVLTHERIRWQINDGIRMIKEKKL
ncbi:MAG: hypothetical protein HZB41_07320 [Ignavibacteriae bacterium]|nr:hypothetical protein [Ignavibacteriota bacterium]